MASIPTGEVVNDFLVKHFPDIVDLGFTTKIEDDFDMHDDEEFRQNIDSIREQQEEVLARRRAAIPAVEKIVAGAVDDWTRWVEARGPGSAAALACAQTARERAPWARPGHHAPPRP